MRHSLIFVAMALLSGCAATIPITADNTSLNIAKSVTKEDGPQGISIEQSINGKVYAYTTFNWTPPEPAGKHKVETKWFSKGKYILSVSYDYNFTKPPFSVWHNTTAASLGVGPARVEVYADGAPVGAKDFTIKEDTPK